MATNRSTQAALTIALSLFVMLTFALGVTTYLFFTKRQQADEAQETAEQQTEEAQAELGATKDEMETLRGIIGVAADAPIADVETGLADLFEGDFAGFTGDQKSYLKLIEWLRAEFRDKSAKVKTAEEQQRETKAKADAAVQAAVDAQKQAETAAAEAKAAFQKATEDFNTKWAAHEAKQGTLLEEKQGEERKARDLESLKTQIASVGDYLPPERKPAFENVKKDPAGQLELIRNELRNQTKAIIKLNEWLTVARMADPAVQEAVATLRPAEDRIAGFDGRVVDVDPRTDTALVSTPSTAGIRPGLVLHVFPPDEQRPQFGNRKAVLEVTVVEGPGTVRTAIRREDDRNPILSGDGVASSLWATGIAPAIMIVGYADVDQDGRSDHERLAALATSAGGRIVDGVAADTALVVDLGQPAQTEGRDEAPGWSAEEKRRDRALKTAKTYGVRVGGMDVLLDMLGLDADSFTAGRLPRGRSSGRFPPSR
jgi:hypothetical protein